MENRMTESERQATFEQFDKEQRKIYFKGKIIILVIAILNIVCSIVTCALNFNFWTLVALIIQIVLSSALYSGINWVRYLFAAGATIAVFYVFYILGFVYNFNVVRIPNMALYLLFMAYCIICSIVLFTNKSVSEYIYTRGNT